MLGSLNYVVEPLNDVGFTECLAMFSTLMKLISTCYEWWTTS